MARGVGSGLTRRGERGAFKRRTLCLLAAIGGLGLAGCGSASSNEVASCLATELNYNVTTGCSGQQMTEFERSHPVTVTCTHQGANEYICRASNGAFYEVTYDGQTIVYQQTQ